MRRFALAMVAGLALATLPAVTPAHAASCTTNPRFSGTFVQPDLIDGWTGTQLANELGHLTDACVGDVVLQWTADSKHHTAIYDTGLSGYTQSTATDVVDRLLSATESAGMGVWVGLQINDDWWQKYATDATWLGNEAAAAADLAEELYDWYGAYDSFDGWYLSFEVDDVHFTGATEQGRMIDFYQDVIAALDTIAPGLPVATAPFFNATSAEGQTPAQWQSTWTTLLASSPIDVIALQDGVGAGHAQTADLATWFGAMANAIAAARPATQLYADTETFVIGASGFQPMPVADIVAHMSAVSSYVDGYWSFAYDHYQSPQAPYSTAYHQTYLAYLNTGAVETTAPSQPTGLAATANNAQKITLSWTASTDNIGVAGYHVYRGGALVATRHGSTGSFVDDQLDGSNTYSYTVRAFDGAGNLSTTSGTASATTPAMPSYPTNHAAGRTYTASVAADAAYPDSGGELTDGVHGAALYGAAWQGRNAAGVYTFTIDLGSSKTINSINSSWLQVRDDYVFLPATITYQVSSNGTSYTTAGTIVRPAVSSALQTKTYRLISLNLTARYVRVQVDGGSAWSMVDEVEVRAT